jgi:hypothetical protein
MKVFEEEYNPDSGCREAILLGLKALNAATEGKFDVNTVEMGIAEQNLFGIAAGLAKAGLIPFVSTFSAFATMRAGEFVRTDICYQNLNCKIIATHGGTPHPLVHLIGQIRQIFVEMGFQEVESYVMVTLYLLILVLHSWVFKAMLR